ncbi:MAG: hypothetical protein F9K24_17870 [Leptonema illini]|uniref:DUF1640 domain-containing protein n=1 Tax=Leptonema illini TaxID=183 RepID=A0A833GYK2_9LEPT|nr:MAG: hypothetical protein F9K24_17870 [Leptonema illini]
MRSDFSDLRTHVADFRAETKTEIAELRGEMRTGIAELQSEMLRGFVNVQREFAGVHKEISSQTKWILTGLALAVTLYPIVNRLLLGILP